MESGTKVRPLPSGETVPTAIAATSSPLPFPSSCNVHSAIVILVITVSSPHSCYFCHFPRSSMFLKDAGAKWKPPLQPRLEQTIAHPSAFPEQHNTKPQRCYCVLGTTVRPLKSTKRFIIQILRLQVLTEESMKMAVFRGIASCSLVEFNRRSISNSCLQLEGDRPDNGAIIQASFPNGLIILIALYRVGHK
jgi:hypothetical protein